MAFTVKIPKRIKEVASNISPDEMTKISISWEASLQALEGRKKSRESKLPERLLRITLENFPEELPKEQTGFTDLSLALAKFFPHPYAKEDSLWWFQFRQSRVLNSKRTSRLLLNAVQQAIFDNDLAFFKRLGRRLSESPKPVMIPLRGDKLRGLMLYHWMDIEDTGVAFCYFTDQAVAEFLKIVARESSPTLDAVRTARKRELKLLQTKTKLVHKVTNQGQTIVLE